MPRKSEANEIPGIHSPALAGGIMDDNRKRAYRDMIYWAMLDLRSHTPISPYTFDRWNPRVWVLLATRLRRTMIIADWMHNLAMFSAWDFNGFREEMFWNMYRNIQNQFPHIAIDSYKARFDNELARVSTGFQARNA